jgi:integrase
VCRPIDLARFRDEIRELYAPPVRRPKTRTKVLQALDEFGATGFGSTEDLTPLNIKRWLAAHPDRPGTTAKSLLSSLRAACAYAEGMDYITKSPFWFKFGVRATSTRVKKHLSAAHVAALLNRLEAEAENDWRSARLNALVALVCYTGVRKMEALLLRREDINLDERVIYLVDRAGKNPLKTVAAAAPIPMPEALAPVLEKWLPRTTSDWVYPNLRGEGPWTEGSPGAKPLDQLKAACVRAGVPVVTLHELRHTWSTHAESLWGLSDTVIQRVLRHTSTRTQLVYRKADLENLRAKVRDIRFDATPPQGREQRHGA